MPESTDPNVTAATPVYEEAIAEEVKNIMGDFIHELNGIRIEVTLHRRQRTLRQIMAAGLRDLANWVNG